MSSVLENYPEQSLKETDIETLTNLIDKYENKINPSVINDIKGLIISINVKLGKKPYQNELRQLKKQDEKFQLKTGAIIDANLDLVDYTLNHLSTANHNFSTEYFDKQLQSIKEITPNLIIDILENVKDNYKYIYTKRTGEEELYDLLYDPDEHFSIMQDKWFDVDRKLYVECKEEYYYPFWDELPALREVFQQERKRIWRNGDLKVVIKSNIKDKLRPIYDKYIRWIGKI